ncbi:hypothetical protein [Paraflavitalea soli]|nr:hypothetical protein [Paraflavitalea soli]
MRRSLPYISYCLLLMVIVGCSCNQSKRLNERVTLWRNDKIPYGTYYAHENLQRIFPEASIINHKTSPDPYQKASIRDAFGQYDDNVGKTCYLIIANEVMPDDKEIEGLIGLVSRGAKIFISSSSIDETLLDSLQLKTSLYTGFYNSHDSLSVQISDPVSWKESTYTYPGKAFDNYFSYLDSSITTVLGKNEDGKANFVKISYESGGAFYIHLAPMALTNFFLLHKENKAYYDQVLSWLPRNIEVVRWDDYFRNSTRGEGKDGSGANNAYKALGWLLNQKSFAWAAGLLLLLLLLIYLVESKRKQRIIPVIQPLRNASLDFVKTIGRMYFQRKDNKDLSHKMTVHFLSYVRNRYNIRSSVMDEDFVKRLTYKSGYDQQAVQALVYDLQFAQDAPQVSDHALLELNHKLETFYKYA